MDDTFDFEPYRVPEHINIKGTDGRDAIRAVYHFFAMAYWSYKRQRADDKMRKHGTYLEHETIVTEFKEGLDEQG